MLALRESDLGPGQPLLGKVEEGPLGHEDRPPRPVAASFEAEALQERRGETRDAEAVDPAERAEVGLEAARALRLRDREERRADPRRLLLHGRHEEVRDLAPVGGEEAEVVEEGAPRACLGAREERPVDGEAIRARGPGRDRPREPEGLGDRADTLLRHRGEGDGEEREGDEAAHRRHSFSRGARTNFWSATATRAREIARPTKEATR